MAKPFVVRDPVHGYLQVAAHERILVDHPITQRLRRINQTGLADLVYPEARTSRFAHSLGAMHLASQFVVSCIENADESVAIEFFDQLRNLDVIKSFSLKLEEMDSLLFVDTLEGGGLYSGRAVFRHKRLRRKERHYKRLLGLAEAGLRLAALFHDLGHLPFSHDMEFALDEYVSRRRLSQKRVPFGLGALVAERPHEVVGHQIANLVFQTLVKGETTPPVRAAFGLARSILGVASNFYDFPQPNASAVEWLHSLVDGEVDVDRADYLLRDGRALGFEFAVYDLERLVSNLVLVKDDELGFTTAVEERGFSSLVTFYLSRSRSNEYLVRHHKVAQIAAAFRYTASRVLETSPCVSFLADLNRLGQDNQYSDERAEKLLNQFAKYDDTWWLQVLNNAVVGNDPLFRACKELLIHRKKTLSSIWKRKGNLAPEFVSQLNEVFVTSNLPQVSRLREKLVKRRILILIHGFEPIRVRPIGKWQDKSLMLLKRGDGSIRPVSEHSVLIESLRNVWQQEVHLHAFSANVTPPDVQTVVRLILSLMQKKSSMSLDKT